MLKPLSDNIIVLRDTVQDRLESGIHVPASAQKVPKTGTVVMAGPGSYQNGTFVATLVKPGDRVVFGSYCGSDLELDGTTYLLLREADIVGILTP